MKNKKISKICVMIAIIFTALFGSGCGGAFKQSKCLESVKKAFPESEVSMIPDEDYSFIVRDDDGSIWYVETMNLTNVEITQKSSIFEANCKVCNNK